MEKALHRPALIVIMGVLGFMLATAFNTANRDTVVQPERATALVEVVHDLEDQRDGLEARLSELRAQVVDLEATAAAEQGVRESFMRELDAARLAAGLVGIRGEGVEIILKDSTEVAPGTDPNLYLIHDSDMSAVVNALFVGGAEAVEVNGERVVATTPIRCAGSTILVNSRRLGGPYTIRAVGDSDLLTAAVTEDAAAGLLFDAYRTQYGLQVSISKMSDVQVTAYGGSFRPKYASIAEDGV